MRFAHTAIVALIAVWLAAAGMAVADDGTWAVDASGDWDDPSNWVDGVIADGADGTAYFTRAVSTYRYVDLQNDRSIGHLVGSNDGGSDWGWYLSGSDRTLTLATTAGVPTIHKINLLMLDCRLAGNQGFLVSGSGLLYIDGDATGLSGDIETTGAQRIQFSADTTLGPNTNLVLGDQADVVVEGSISFGGLSGPRGTYLKFYNGGCLTIGTGGQTSTFEGLIWQIGGVVSVVKAGAGMLTLTGDGLRHKWSGGTVLQGGVLSVSSQLNLGDGAGEAGPLTFDGGTLRVTGTTFAEYTRGYNWTDNGGGFDIADPTHTFTINDTLTSGGSMTKLGPGTLVLTGANVFKGVTTIEEGTLRLEHPEALSGTTIDVPATGLDLSGVSGTLFFGGISGSGDLPPCDSLIVGWNSQETTYSGSFVSCGGLMKTGFGQTTFDGDTSALTGPLSVVGGDLIVSTAGSPGWAAITVNGGRLVLTAGSSNCASFVFGDAGTGSVAISGEDTVLTVAGTSVLAQDPGSTGTLEISGGTLRAESNLRIGYAGTGAVEHTGGTVRCDGTFRLGNETTGDGVYNLSGAGRLNAHGQYAVVGFYGHGTLNQSGGQVTANSLYLAERAGSVGEYELSDGSVSASTINVGMHGSGTLRQTGGTITCTQINVGTVSDGTGLYEVGGGTTTVGTLHIGGGAGTVNVGPSATLTTTDLGVEIATGGLLTGAGMIGGDVHNAGGAVEPGTPGPSMLTLGGAFTQDASGTFRVEIGGATPGTEHDQLSVIGAATLGGTLEISAINGYVLEPGREYVILTAGAIAGTFDDVVGLPEYFEVTYNADNVTISMIICPGDCDGDHDVDLDDFESFAACMEGPSARVSGECQCADLGEDGDVDLGDFAEFQRYFTGAQP